MLRRTLLIASLVVVCPSLLFAQGNGTVKATQKIGTNAGNFTGPLANGDVFGQSSTELGDFDGDGVGDLVVGARSDNDGGLDTGAIWLLFLNVDGTVKAHQKISATVGGFTGVLDTLDNFGFDVATLGDLNGDGVVDLAVGALLDDDGGPDRGSVWILFLNADGTVKTQQKISDTQGGFTGTLGDGARFGTSVAALGDLNNDGVNDLAVGAAKDSGTGAVWILFLNADGTVKSHQKISAATGGFTGFLEMGDMFGISLGELGDFDGDGRGELAVGAFGDDDGGTNRGAVWILFLNADGTVASSRKISDTQGGFTGGLADLDRFGTSITCVPDLTGDGIDDLVVGAFYDDVLSGSVWVLFLNDDGTVMGHQKISNTEGNFPARLPDKAEFGLSLSSPGDLDGDGVHDIVVGSIGDPGNGFSQGAVWVLFLNGELPTPVVLQSFESLWVDDHVEVRWILLDAGDDVTFDVLRRERTDGVYKTFDPAIVSEAGQFSFRDAATRPGRDYTYRVTIFEAGAAVTSFETTVTIPIPRVALHPTHPNPFNPSTTIPYTLDEDGHVLLQVFDASGRLVRTLIDRRVAAGDHSQTWDGRNHSGQPVASGTYLIRLTTGGTTLTRKATLLK